MRAIEGDKCTPQRSGSKRDFVVGCYCDGKLLELPSRCPHEGECRIGRHARRHRKHGPGFALTILRCHRHTVCFTVYPEGWTPYGRAAIATAERPSRNTRSLFAAALAAAAGCLWPELSGQEECARTQRRRIERCGRVLGLGESDWESRAILLRLPLAALRDARTDWSRSRYRGPRGQIVAATLDAMSWDDSSWQRLIQAGFESGCWGQAWCYEGGGAPIPILFSGAERAPVRL